MADAENDRDLIIEAVRKAGDIILSFCRTSLRHWEKSKGERVSEADIAANDCLQECLRSVHPDYGWLSEETIDDKSRFEAQRSFCVDPIDGTRAFIKGRPEFTISVAIIENNQPVVGVVYDPSADRLWDAVFDQGARLNGQPIGVSTRKTLKGACFMGDQGHYGIIEKLGASAHCVNSVALRLSECAHGAYDGLIAMRPKMDWDIAAAALVFSQAGGIISDHCGNRLKFNQDIARQPPPLAAGPDLHARLLEKMKNGVHHGA